MRKPSDGMVFLIIGERCPYRDGAAVAKLAVRRVNAGGDCPFRYLYRWRNGWLHVQPGLHRQVQGSAYRNVATVVWLAVRRV